MSRQAGIYQITDPETGESYIGATRDLARRQSDHIGALRAGTHTALLQAAWDKQPGALVWSVIEYVDDIKLLGEREQFHLDKRFAERGSHELNVKRGGIGLDTPDYDLAKITLSLPASTLDKLRAVTQKRHGRVDRFVSATLDQLILEAYAREVEQEGEAVKRG